MPSIRQPLAMKIARGPSSNYKSRKRRDGRLSILVTSALILTILGSAFGRVSVATDEQNVQQITTIRTSFTTSTVTRTCAVEDLSTDKEYYYLGETVTIDLCYIPHPCEARISTPHDVVVLLNGNAVATLDSNIGPQLCGDDPGYSYQPNVEGTYVVQFRTTYQSRYAVVAQVEFQVGVNENGSPVGGEVLQINGLELPATCITLSLVIASVVASAVLLVKKLES